VEATVMDGNTASSALPRRAGFECEGVLCERMLKRGAFRDVQMFGLTRSGCAARTE
jgi:RimJ/RimL family protein N-acetyltransferase